MPIANILTVGLIVTDVALLLYKKHSKTSHERVEDMQVTLNQTEIETAIISYIAEQGISITGRKVAVSLLAGRGVNGMSATIDIKNEGEEDEETAETPQAADAPIDEKSDDSDGTAVLFGH